MKSITKLYVFLKGWPSIPIFFIAREHLSLDIAMALAAGYACIYTLVALGCSLISKLDYSLFFFWMLGVGTLSLDRAGRLLYFQEHFSFFLLLSLFLAAYLPLVFKGEPFTTAFAKKRVPEDLWRTNQFRRINHLMTTVWAGIFFISLLATLLPGPLGYGAPVLLSLFAGIPFTRRFPQYYLSRRTPLQTLPPRDLPSENIPPHPAVSISNDQSRELTVEARKKTAAQMGPIEKALVIFGSPRGKKGHTYQLLEQFIQGMRDGGVATETIILPEHTIKPCTGCFSCWYKTPGVCIHKDDMAELLNKLDDADLIVFAQPLYVFSVPGIMKNFLDRMLPRLMPYLTENKDGTTTHPLRNMKSSGNRLLIFSVCGFPEPEHFSGLQTMFRHLAHVSGSPIIGELLRPASESLRFGSSLGRKYRNMRTAIYQAGSQVARQGYVDLATEAAVSQPLFNNMQSFREVANRFWDVAIDYEKRKKSGEILPPIETFLQKDVGLFFKGMASMFSADDWHEGDKIIQFDIIGIPHETYSLQIKNNQCLAVAGMSPDADLTIRTPWEIWKKIANNEISGQEAYMNKEYTATGDIGLLQRFQQAFTAS